MSFLNNNFNSDFNKNILTNVKNKLSSICVIHIELIYPHTKDEFKLLHKLITEFIDNLNSSSNVFNNYKINIITKINSIISTYNSLISEHNFGSFSSFNSVNTSNMIMEYFNLINELSFLNSKIASISYPHINEHLFISNINPNSFYFQDNNFTNFNENINNMINISDNNFSIHTLNHNFNPSLDLNSLNLVYNNNLNNLNNLNISSLSPLTPLSNLDINNKKKTGLKEISSNIINTNDNKNFKKINIKKIHKKNTSNNSLTSLNTSSSSENSEEIFRKKQREKIKSFSEPVIVKKDIYILNQKENTLPKNNLDREIKINFKKSFIII